MLLFVVICSWAVVAKRGAKDEAGGAAGQIEEARIEGGPMCFFQACGSSKISF
jgi:hypothetical protein